jgi:hypothetical protein
MKEENEEVQKKESPKDFGESSGADEILINKDIKFKEVMGEDIQKLSGKTKAIPFPIEVFQSVFRDVIQATNETLNFPIDYSAACILTAVATAIGKTAVLEVKNGWREFCPIYMDLLGNAGAMKSHPLDMFFSIIKMIDSEEYQKYTPLLEAYEEYLSLTKKEKLKVEKKVEPLLVKTIMSNFTNEILSKRINDNSRSVCVVSEELETWLLGMNNYSKTDQSSTYLSMWSVKRTDVDRVSNHKRPLIIERPFLCIIGSSQPRKLRKMFPTDKSDSGFLQRFLWAFPAVSLKQCINEKELDPIYLEKYNSWIRNYFENYRPVVYPDGQPKAKIYKFTPEAKKVFLDWQATNTKKVNDAGDSLLSEEYNKFDVHFLRFALIMQIMEDSTVSFIDIKAAQNAVKLCAYFENTMLRVMSIIENESEIDMLKVAVHLVGKGMTQLDATKYTGVSQATISRHSKK